MARLITALTQQERLNFLLTNRIPRKLVTRFMGWFSKIENRYLTRISIAVWKFFSDELNFTESKKQVFNSLHDCFIRELKDDARSIDGHVNTVISPCDAIVGSYGEIEDTQVFQAKGFPYELCDLISDKALLNKYRNGNYLTLRLKSSMYHRFHAPIDGHVSRVTYISGDTWNVNPIALKRIENLYCKNERAVLELKRDDSALDILLVPVAAIMVASIRLHCLPDQLSMNYRGPDVIPCSAQYQKGDEMGYFEHGSTIILFTSGHYTINENIESGDRIYMGQALLTRDVE